MNNNSTASPKLGAILLCFFLSGSAGLIYQVVWSKALGLIFGHTVYAIATVLAVFMGGLALGSAFLARWTERHPNPVALYGWLEIAVAVTAAVSPLGLTGVRALYGAAYPSVSHSIPLLIGLRFLGAAIVLLLPTFLMGGTLPILIRGVARTSDELGQKLSRLYWVNTLGAVAGTLLAGFVLLPGFGLWITISVAIVLNLVAGGIALLVSRGSVSIHENVEPATIQSSSSVPATSLYLYPAFALVGATAIAYEVAWTRLLSTTLGSTTYAFTLMLGTFLLGIVLGSFAFELWISRGKRVSLHTFALTQTLTGIAAMLFLLFFQKLPEIVPPIIQATHETFPGLILAQFVTSALAMLPAAIIFGFNFPVVTLLIAGPAGAKGHGTAVGRAYAANTLGAILGATVTGFWLMPIIGGFKLLALVAGCNLLLALLLEFFAEPRRLAALASNAVVLFLTIWIGFSGLFYNAALSTFLAVLYWDRFKGSLSLAEMAGRYDMVFVEDGLNATVSVARRENSLTLRTNGKVDASDKDTLTQLAIGHMGGMLHPSPRKVLMIGFGAGMSLSGLSRYPEVEQMDCVEIEPGMVDAAPFLPTLNRDILKDPRVHMFYDDGRNFLLTTREKYDLIVSQPSNPWIAGISALFTEEFYREARGRLRPGGMLVQWLQGYSIYPEDFRMIVATFAPQFPRVTLWRLHGADFLLIAQTDTKPLTLDRVRSLWTNAGLRADFDEMGMHAPEGMVAFYALDDADVRKLGEGAYKNTDNHTRLEYRAPRALMAWKAQGEIDEMLRKARVSAVPKDLILDNPKLALIAAADTQISNGALDSAARLLATFPPPNPVDPAVEVLRGRLRMKVERFAEAKAAFELVLSAEPNSVPALQGLGEIQRRAGDNARAAGLLQKALSLEPRNVEAINSMMLVERTQQHWAAAINWQTRRIASDPKAGSIEYTRLGELLFSSGDEARAKRAFEAALERDYYDYPAHLNLAEIARAHREWAEARKHLEFVARLSPELTPQTFLNLAVVCREMNDTHAAAAALRKGYRIHPDDPELKRVAAQL